MSQTRSPLHKCTAILTSVKKCILDGLFPIRCLGCGILDEWICATCHTTLPIITEQHCPMCKKHVTNNGETCFECMQKGAIIDGAFVVSHYSDTLLKRAIHYYKYRFVRDLSEPLALLVAQALQNATLPTPDIIIPVPLHKRRYRWRGFNHAEELARALDLRIPVITDILIRTRYTKPQAQKKNRKYRKQNMRDAFCVTRTESVNQKQILLIDDIMTTGATLEECARALKKSGAATIHCLVLARE